LHADVERGFGDGPAELEVDVLGTVLREADRFGVELVWTNLEIIRDIVVFTAR
jgi:hypothetical protein